MKHNYTERNIDIIKALIDARKAKKLTQSELALRLGVPQSYISRLESGRLDLRLSSLIDIARFLNLEVLLMPSSMIPVVNSLNSSMTIGENRPLYSLDDIDEEVD